MKTVIALQLILFVSILPVNAKEVMTWAKHEWSPVYISKGKDQGRGIFDGITQILTENLPEYEHTFIIANPVRISREIEAGNNICFPSSLKTPEREKTSYFSVPTIIMFPHGIVFNKETLSKIKNVSHVVSLETILREHPELRLGLSKGRSYGKTIDAILDKYVKTGQIQRLANQDLSSSLKMVSVGRFDYTLAYPPEVSYLAHQLELNENLQIMDIEEIEDQWIVGYVRCPKNDLGDEAIQKINRVLREVRLTDEYKFHVIKWIPEQLKESILEAYDRMMLVE